MDFDLLGRIVTGVLAVSTFIAIALVGLMVGTVRTLRDSNTDLRARVEDLEKERTEDNATITSVVAKLSEAHAENRLLMSMVQGRVEWTAISDQLEAYHHQSTQTLSEIRQLLENRA